MADPGKIIARIRALGSNIILDGSRLRVINREKIPEHALQFVRDHGRDIAAFLEGEAEFEERAAIMEIDGGLTRPVAEYLTRLLQNSVPADADAADWSWFVSQAAKIVDEALPTRRAA